MRPDLPFGNPRALGLARRHENELEYLPQPVPGADGDGRLRRATARVVPVGVGVSVYAADSAKPRKYRDIRGTRTPLPCR